MIDPAPRTPAQQADTLDDLADQLEADTDPDSPLLMLELHHADAADLRAGAAALRASVRPLFPDPQPGTTADSSRVDLPGRSTSDPRVHHSVDSNNMMTDTSTSPALSVRQQVIAAAQKMQDTDLGYDYTLDAFETRAVLAAAREALTIARERLQPEFEQYGMVYRRTVTANVLDELLSSLSGAPDAMDLNQRPIHGMAESACDNRAAEVYAHIDHVTAGAPDVGNRRELGSDVNDVRDDGVSRVHRVDSGPTRSPALTPFDPVVAQDRIRSLRFLASRPNCLHPSFLLAVADLLEAAIAAISRPPTPQEP